jgi:hypothetical protein
MHAFFALITRQWFFYLWRWVFLVFFLKNWILNYFYNYYKVLLLFKLESLDSWNLWPKANNLRIERFVDLTICKVRYAGGNVKCMPVDNVSIFHNPLKLRIILFRLDLIKLVMLKLLNRILLPRFKYVILQLCVKWHMLSRLKIEIEIENYMTFYNFKWIQVQYYLIGSYMLIVVCWK